MLPQQQRDQGLAENLDCSPAKLTQQKSNQQVNPPESIYFTLARAGNYSLYLKFKKKNPITLFGNILPL